MVLKELRQIDTFAKTSTPAVAQKTTTGALVTLLSVALALVLILAEVSRFLSPSSKHQVLVDTSNNGELEINFDITFPCAACPVLSLDVMDASGLRNSTASRSVKTHRLDSNGNDLGLCTQRIDPVDLRDNESAQCFGCFDAEGECCNSCEALENAYKASNLEFTEEIMRKAPQCSQRRYLSLCESMRGEGCRWIGWVKVNKFPGNMHFAPGVVLERDNFHGHIIQGLEGLGESFNLSHKINALWIGDRNSSLKKPALEGETKADSSPSKLYEYHLRLVNSVFVDSEAASGEKPLSSSYEYSVTQNEKKAVNGTTLTGVFFHYEISPMKIERSQGRSMRLVELVINVLSIVGGVYALSTLIDALLFRVEQLVAYKQSMNKQL